MILSAKGKIGAAAAVGALSLIANEALAQHRSTLTPVAAITREHSGRHMDMFYAKYRNTAPLGMHFSPIRRDTSHFQIRIEISASGI